MMRQRKLNPLFRQWLGDVQGFLINEQGDIVFCQKTGVTFSVSLVGDGRFMQMQYLVCEIPSRGKADYFYEALVLNALQPVGHVAYLGVDPVNDHLVLNSTLSTRWVYRASIGLHFKRFSEKAWNLQSQLKKDMYFQVASF
ncbi:hypothetical protein [Acanthopleuribacter pedis]|uniref:Uncharacterized protein n=1 Tax=Acanthopleuribacter pedis TaxID=442870 RepID=A0A8J7U523_9BACT|nr:hypothetical protein [Acanthopleuribacter pedis]MBO1321257.1 hypothetical protein [Acanthopleuribacter pedis]